MAIGRAAEVLGAALALWSMAMFSLTVYLHRYLAHRSFELNRAGRTISRGTFMFVLWTQRIPWIGIHRAHHRYAATDRDPHPVELLGAANAFVHAQRVYRTAVRSPDMWRVFVTDVAEDRLDRLHRRLPFLGPAVSVAVGSYFMGFRTFVGAYVVFVVMLQLTFSALLSMTHSVGAKPTSAPGRNSHVLGVLLWGEGYHHNHHRHPRRPTTLDGWGLDFAYIVVRALVLVRLADWN
jgi:fatty-acid desaturase